MSAVSERWMIKMKIRRICTLYWSATGNTEKVVRAIGKRLAACLSCPEEAYNFTPQAARSECLSFQDGDFVVVGAPTYAGKLPNKILPDFQSKLIGNGAAAAAVVTFGNRSYDNSLAELVKTLGDAGFQLAGGAAFACRHAFSDLLGGGRPDTADLRDAEHFAEQLAERILGTEQLSAMLTVPGDAAAAYYIPRGTDGEPAKFLKAKPLTDRETCTNCGDCVRLCPLGSIDAVDVTQVPGLCIKCQACVRGCTVHAKYFDDPAFLSHVAMLEQNYASPLKKNEFYFA